MKTSPMAMASTRDRRQFFFERGRAGIAHDVLEVFAEAGIARVGACPPSSRSCRRPMGARPVPSAKRRPGHHPYS